MKTKVFSSLVVFFTVFFSTSASAAPVTMLLENLSADQADPFFEEGFAILAPGEHLHATFNNQFTLPGLGSNAAQMAADTKGSILFRDDDANGIADGAFNMISLEAINIFGADFSGAAYAVKIEGFLGNVSKGVTLLTSGAGDIIEFSSWEGAVDLVQFSFESQGSYGNFSTFTGDDFKFDNITVEAAVAPVPVPAAVWLFVSALGGLGVMRRKQVIT